MADNKEAEAKKRIINHMNADHQDSVGTLNNVDDIVLMLADHTICRTLLPGLLFLRR